MLWHLGTHECCIFPFPLTPPPYHPRSYTQEQVLTGIKVWLDQELSQSSTLERITRLAMWTRGNTLNHLIVFKARWSPPPRPPGLWFISWSLIWHISFTPAPSNWGKGRLRVELKHISPVAHPTLQLMSFLFHSWRNRLGDTKGLPKVTQPWDSWRLLISSSAHHSGIETHCDRDANV